MSRIVYNFPPTILYGWGKVKSVGGCIKDLNSNKVLVVTDDGVKHAGLLEKLEASLIRERLDYTTFSGVQQNPTDRNVEKGLDTYKKKGCDAVIAIGGGSPMDAAKGIVLMATHRGRLEDYYRDAVSRRKITSHLPDFIAIPTTSGTGSEVSRGAIITDTSQNRKRSIGSHNLLPKVVVLDPELTITMPPRLTAYTGLDALSHSVEAFTVNSYAPIADAFAREGIRLIAASLIRAFKDGSNRRARADMMMASTMGALAFQKGLGAVHSLAHQLSTQTDIPHGAACGIMLPHVMQFNMTEGPLKDRVLAKYAEIAQIFHVDISRISVNEGAKLAKESIRKLLKQLSVNQHLHKWGVEEEDIQVMARNAMLDHCHPRNPRTCHEADMVALYKAALK